MELNSVSKYVVNQGCELINNLIIKNRKYNISTRNLFSLSKSLHALQNYPNIVLNGNITFITVIKWPKGGTSYYEFVVGCDFFRLSSGGSDYDENVGSDGYSREIYPSPEIKIDEDIYLCDIDDWFVGFYEHIGNNGEGLEIYDETEIINDI